jgi:hypothetical protein
MKEEGRKGKVERKGREMEEEGMQSAQSERREIQTRQDHGRVASDPFQYELSVDEERVEGGTCRQVGTRIRKGVREKRWVRADGRPKCRSYRKTTAGPDWNS